MHVFLYQNKLGENTSKKKNKNLQIKRAFEELFQRQRKKMKLLYDIEFINFSIKKNISKLRVNDKLEEEICNMYLRRKS